MIDPVILPPAILAEAKSWREMCRQRWDTVKEYPQIADATLVSPVDGSQRRVVLRFALSNVGKGRTIPGLRNKDGRVYGEGYTVILCREKITSQNDLLPILLHEMTHAVDPWFDFDMFMQNPPERKPIALTSREQYRLFSEQRAFTAMWTEELNKDFLQGRFLNASASVAQFCHRSPEFRAFVENTSDLIDQTKEHLWRIVEMLMLRKAMVTGPTFIPSPRV
jgi:hypothetical protein